jgi:thioredoxin-related protein
MKNILIYTMMLLTLLSVSTHKKIEPLAIGAVLPLADVKMLDVVSDTEKSLQEIKTDKGLLVMFSCNTCPFVIANQSRTKHVIKAARGKGFGVVVINSNEGKRTKDDNRAQMKLYAEAQQYHVPYTIDENSKIADAFGATVTPEVFLFDKDSKLVYRGAIDNSPKDGAKATEPFLANAINALLKGEAVKVTTSKGVGCSIKRKS